MQKKKKKSSIAPAFQLINFYFSYARISQYTFEMLFSKRVEAVNILVSLAQYMNGIKANSQGVYQQADYVQKREAPTAALFQNVVF